MRELDAAIEYLEAIGNLEEQNKIKMETIICLNCWLELYQGNLMSAPGCHEGPAGSYSNNAVESPNLVKLCN